jgi:hypothetical protein
VAVETKLAEKRTKAEAPLDPRQEYTERFEARKQLARQLDQHLDRLGLGRLAAVSTALVVAWLIWGLKLLAGWWLALPVLLFLLLVFRYDHVWRRWRRSLRAVRYYERGLERLADHWQDKGHKGQRFLEHKSLYAADLDIFGDNSLFERLCLARTRPGEEMLSRWLMEPATPEEIRTRQAAVHELRRLLDLREDLALLGAEVPPVDFAELGTWGAAPAVLTSGPLRLAVGGLALCNVLTAVGWLVFGWNALFFAVSLLLSTAAIWSLTRRVHQVLEPIEEMGRELVLLSGVLARLERERFQSPLLSKLHEAILVAGTLPSWQIAKLAGWVDWLNSIRNQFFLPLALLLLWRTQMAYAVESWRRHSGRAIHEWLAAIASLEALNSLAGYAYECPEHVFPEIATGAACFEAEALGHPLLPAINCVRNDVHLDEGRRVLIVSGSNMSGKSTMLRTVGTNAVLALAGAPVRARRLRLTPVALCATLRIQDSLLAGESRFKAEINRIRELLEHARQELPVLFLLDELFHGTNSHDRCIGAEALTRQLLAGHAIGLLTTHDLALTQIAAQLGDQVQNVHFADQFVGGEMHFDYKMRPGVVPHSNALALMRAIGLKV